NDGTINSVDGAIQQQTVGVTTDFYGPALAANIVPAAAPVVASTTYLPTAKLMMVAADPSGLSSFTISLDGSTPVSLLSQLNANGGLGLTLSQVATQTGRTLADGAHTIVLAARDRFNNAAPSLTLNFNIKTSIPAAPAQPVVVTSSGTLLSGGVVNTGV